MIGEQIGELKGKITGQRILDVEGPTAETSVSASGSLKGVQIRETLTFVGRPTTANGVIHGKGIGVIMAGESELNLYRRRNRKNCFFWKDILAWNCLL